ncbi:hypothetical protein E2562_019251 [Oryza meyeriana var. granulata]|uniref:Uncharacterized protein n=1 Tax=Oryza meyeriana var. granulata TaxID=110450 RepID=A0A6G1FAE4_9ORYZ|nr:hypothetical protein E2562_019251 [Oryza meyeriana var. granulata]
MLGFGGTCFNAREFFTTDFPKYCITMLNTFGAADDLDADHDDAPLQFCSIDNVLGLATPPGLVNREVQEELMMVSGEEPASFTQAK